MAMTERRRKMFRLVEAYRRGSEGRKAFCTRHSIPVSTFSWWQYEYGRSHRGGAGRVESPSFVPIAGPSAAQVVEYEFRDGSVVRVPAALGTVEVVAIIRELRGASCSD